MQIAKVCGKATATVKDDSLIGWRLMLVQPLMADGSPDEFPQLAIDELGAGVGDQVLLTTDGAEIQKMMKTKKAPVRYAVIGIVD
ncbi:MAG: EutN/CcmL family microcompartment protein [Planctomycetaceae bacterium]|nr:EutN/CcmL family microcompartment protein [Planctomycetaceae bacterium]